MWGYPHIPVAAELNALCNVDRRGGGVKFPGWRLRSARCAAGILSLGGDHSDLATLVARAVGEQSIVVALCA